MKKETHIGDISLRVSERVKKWTEKNKICNRCVEYVPLKVCFYMYMSQDLCVCAYLCAWRGGSACAPVHYTAEQSTSILSSQESAVFVSWNAAGNKQINK